MTGVAGAAGEAGGAGLAVGMPSGTAPGWLEQVAAIAAAAASAASAAIQAQHRPMQQPLQHHALVVSEHTPESSQHGSPSGQQQRQRQLEPSVEDKEEAEPMLCHGVLKRTADAELDEVRRSNLHKSTNAQSTVAAAGAMQDCESMPQAGSGLSGRLDADALCSGASPTASGKGQVPVQGDACNAQQAALQIVPAAAASKTA